MYIEDSYHPTEYAEYAGIGTFSNDAAQGHPFTEAIVANDGFTLGWKPMKLLLHQRCYEI